MNARDRRKARREAERDPGSAVVHDVPRSLGTREPVLLPAELERNIVDEIVVPELVLPELVLPPELPTPAALPAFITAEWPEAFARAPVTFRRVNVDELRELKAQGQVVDARDLPAETRRELERRIVGDIADQVRKEPLPIVGPITGPVVAPATSKPPRRIRNLRMLLVLSLALAATGDCR